MQKFLSIPVTGEQSQLVSANDIKLIEQFSTTVVKIFYRTDNVKIGKVIRLLPDLSKEGRMARLLIEVNDPLDLKAKNEKQPMLLIGEYVRVNLYV